MQPIGKIILVFICLSISGALTAQQNSVRVLGRHIEIYKASKIVLNFTLEDHSKYDGGTFTLLKPYEKVYSELIKFLDSMNVKSEELKLIKYSTSNYSGTKRSGSYKLLLDSKETALNIQKNLRISGVTECTVSYKFTQNPKDEENRLIKLSIENAKEKATFMANAVNKKIGDVIAIDDYTKEGVGFLGQLFGQYNNSDESKDESKSIIYEILITYQLK